MNFWIQRYIVFLLCCMFSACSQSKPVYINPALESVKIGVVGVIQPMGTTDLLAGYIPENRGLASEDDLLDLNISILSMLKAKTKHTYIFIPAADGSDPTVTRVAGENSALKYWVEVGKKVGVDILIIPYILSWNQRAGSSVGVTSSAELIMDYFLIDVRGEGSLLSRSHFDEKQESLAKNLLNIGLFVKRGGRWVTVEELANEATQRMISDFGL